MNSLAFLLATVVAAAACGGAQEPGATTPGTGSAGSGAPVTAGDVPPFEIPAIEIKGVVFQPAALGRPNMLVVEAKKKVTLDKQRAVFVSTKDPLQKEAQAAILATMLYQDSKDKKGDEQKKDWSEARQALADAAAISKDKVDEITLHLLGIYELLLEDYPAAEKAWADLVAKSPKDKEAAYNRAWWAYSLLVQAKNAEALAVVKDEPATDKQPELAYVTAWAKWRTGDDAGAWQAIATAAKGWDQNDRAGIKNDVVLFAGRANVSLDQVLPQIFALFGKQPADHYEALQSMTKSYAFAGRWADAVAAAEKTLATLADKVPSNDLISIRFAEADYTMRLDDPVTVAKYATLAVQGLAKCGAACTAQDQQNVVLSVFNFAARLHSVFATANDPRYYQPAHDLYALVNPMIVDVARRNQALEYGTKLESSFRYAKAGTGTHDKQVTQGILEGHNQEVQACYEAALLANPKLVGVVGLTLEADGSGTIKGATTDPKSGLEGVSAVAGCVAEHAKAWKLPKRGMSTGVTRIKISYRLSARKE